MNIIVAIDSNFGISKGGAIPWLKTDAARADLKRFRSVTEGSRVTMGRKTWESLPLRPLPGRGNYVLSRTLVAPQPGCTVVQELQDGWIIGGAEVYDAALRSGRVSEVLITMISGDYECDKRFPIETLFALYKVAYSERYTNDFPDKSSSAYINLLLLPIQQPAPPPRYLPSGEITYLALLQEIAVDGQRRRTRNGETLSVFARTLEFDMTDRFPLLTSKRVFFRGVFHELMMFIRGVTDTTVLSDNGVHIWEHNTSASALAAASLPYKPGEMGPMYGYNWRRFGAPYQPPDAPANPVQHKPAPIGFDQLARVLHLISTDPCNRAILMTTYNPAIASQGVLNPCHGIMTQFHVSNDRRLSCLMCQRSADMFLGVPFNIASYALLVHLICSHLNHVNKWSGTANELKPGKLTITLADAHIYVDHLDAVYTQLMRDIPPHPTLTVINAHDNIEDYQWEDVSLNGYEPLPAIKAGVF